LTEYIKHLGDGSSDKTIAEG